MKVGEISSRAKEISVASEKEMVAGGRNAQGKNFRESLLQNQAQSVEEELGQLRGLISQQGIRLGKRVDIKELLHYKRLVSEFLSKAMDGFQRFHREDFFDRRGRHKLYSTVRKINEKLEDLTRAVLAEEQDNLAVLGCIDDIRGLLLDVTL